MRILRPLYKITHYPDETLNTDIPKYMCILAAINSRFFFLMEIFINNAVREYLGTHYLETRFGVMLLGNNLV